MLESVWERNLNGVTRDSLIVARVLCLSQSVFLGRNRALQVVVKAGAYKLTYRSTMLETYKQKSGTGLHTAGEAILVIVENY